MNNKEVDSVLTKFSIPQGDFQFNEIKSGLINDSYLVKSLNESEKKYILQNINTSIFPEVNDLMNNVVHVSEHIDQILGSNKGYENYQNFSFIKTIEGKSFFKCQNQKYWRLVEFIENTSLSTENISEKLASQSGKTLALFHRLTSDIQPDKIVEILPGFHRVDLRYNAFLDISIENNKRYEETKSLYENILSFEFLISKFKEIVEKKDLPIRIAHNDPKLSNILFNENEEAISMIDLDTVMPGYINNDFGDAIRSLTNTSNENEKELSKVDFNYTLFKSYTKSYIKNIQGYITPKEKEYLALFALLITFEQTIRFYGDYLQNDIYYKTDYPNHNLQRTKVQFKLLKQMHKRFDDMQQFILT